MLTIPFKALRLGAETINTKPVKYNKSRISGSNKTTYNLHIRGASMPGDKNKFITTSTCKPQQIENLLNNKIISSYRRDKINTHNFNITNKDIIPIKNNDILVYENHNEEKYLPFAKELILFFDKNSKKLKMDLIENTV